MNDKYEISTFALGYLETMLTDPEVSEVYKVGGQVVLDEVRFMLQERIKDFN